VSLRSEFSEVLLSGFANPDASSVQWANEMAGVLCLRAAQRVREIAVRERGRRDGYTQVLVYERAIRDVLTELEGVA